MSHPVNSGPKVRPPKIQAKPSSGPKSGPKNEDDFKKIPPPAPPPESEPDPPPLDPLPDLKQSNSLDPPDPKPEFTAISMPFRRSIPKLSNLLTHCQSSSHLLCSAHPIYHPEQIARRCGAYDCRRSIYTHTSLATISTLSPSHAEQGPKQAHVFPLH